MVDIKVTNLAKFYVLCLLSEKPRHGYEIIKETGKKLNKNISSGQIYPFLKKLEELGYIESKEREERDKRVFMLTRKGKLFANKMINRFADLISVTIEPKLTVCSHCGCEIYKGGHKEIIKDKEFVFCCCHCAKSYKNEILTD
jgi:DNA-binding PadR family transcriptional regulator